MLTQNEILESIKSISLFKDFKEDRTRLNKIMKYVKVEKYAVGTTIIKEDEKGDKLFVLYKGTVRILKKTLSKEKYTVSLMNSDHNIFFGEIALIDTEQRSATVEAETSCILLSFDRKSFIELCEADPLMGYKITLQIAKKISTTLRKMNLDVVTLFQALVNEVKGSY